MIMTVLTKKISSLKVRTNFGKDLVQRMSYHSFNSNKINRKKSSLSKSVFVKYRALV